MNNVRARFYTDDGSDWVSISVIGDPNVVVRKVRDEDKERFEKDYKAFKAGKKPKIEGTPLENVKGIGEAMAKKLRGKGIETAEDLAALPDGGLNAVGMGAIGLRKSAREYLGILETPVQLVGVAS